MTDTSECVHGLWPVECCTICNGHDAREAREANRVLYTIIARHGHGECVRCGDEIAVGDTISKLAGGGWLCRECAA